MKKLLFILLFSFQVKASPVQTLTIMPDLTVRLMEDHTVPFVSFCFVLKVGDVYDPVHKPLLTGAIMELLEEGTETKEGETLKNILLDHGIQINFMPTHAFLQSGRRHHVLIQVRTMKSHLPKTFDLLKEIFLKPRFDETSLEKWVNRTKALVLNKTENPYFVAENIMRTLLYGATPWGVSYLHPSVITSLASLAPSDLHEQWKNFLTLDRFSLGVCGHITPQELTVLLQDFFKDIPKVSKLNPLKLPPFPKDSMEKIVPMPIPQAIVNLIHPGIPHTYKTYAAYRVMNQVLSGGMSGRLFRTIRDKKGLVYGIQATPIEKMDGPLYLFHFECKNENVPLALHELKKQLSLLKEKGITAEELDQAKLSLMGQEALKYTSTVAIAQRLAYSLYLNEKETFLADTKQAIDALTLPDINHFIKNFIDPHRLQTVVVGQLTSLSYNEDTHEPSSKHSGKSVQKALPKGPGHMGKNSQNAYASLPADLAIVTKTP